MASGDFARSRCVAYRSNGWAGLSRIGRRFVFPCMLIIAVVAACNPSSLPEAITSPTPTQTENGRGDFIVTLEPLVNPGQYARDHGIDATFVYTTALNGFAGNISDAARAGMLRDARVVRIAAEQAFSTESGSQPAASWGLDRIDQRDGALDGTYNFDATGEGVTVYIIDTGIRYSHAEFGGRASFGYDALGGDGTDCHGHGTHVAGTVGGSTYGVAKDVDIVAVRVLSCLGWGTSSTIVAGLDWIAANADRPAVVNMSLGGPTDAAVDAAVQSLIDAGIPVAVAAGNAGANACDYSPARVPDALTVAATDANDMRASWSNWGVCIDWFAPGVGITSAGESNDNAVAVMSGTSMASPHTAGVAALYLENHPNASPQDVTSALATATTKGAVLSSFSASSDLLYSLDDGSDGGGGNQPPVADFSHSCTATTCQFTDSSSDPDGSVVAFQWDFGDGWGHVERNPSHTYDEPGSYPVTLIARDNDGVTSAVTKQVDVGGGGGNAAPVADFTFSCEGTSCQFSDSSSDPDGSVVSWAWDFGDGGASSDRNPSHGYAGPGSYQVKLTVQDNAGASRDVTKPVEIAGPSNAPPSPAFTVTCVGLSCDFVDSSTDPDGTISEWIWDFGDGNAATLASGAAVHHVFPSGGVYRVTLTVTDDSGASSATSRDQQVGLVLTAVGYKVKGRHQIDLNWSGSTSAEVDIFVNGTRVETTTNTGSHTYNTDNRGQGSYVLKVCEAGATVCSAPQTVTF